MERLAFIRQSIEQFCRIPDDFSWDTTFEELGMDSYAIVDFLLALEEKIGFAADDAELLSQNCMRDVEDLIARCMEEDNTIMLKGIAASQGIAIAKANHVYKGRKEIKVDPDQWKKLHDQYMRREINKVQFAKALNISRPTLDKLLKAEK